MLKKLFKIFNKNGEYNDFVINNDAVIIALEAETLRRKKNLSEALNLINRAIDLEPDNDMYHVTKSLIYNDLQEYKSALKEINTALKINKKVEWYFKLREQIKVHLL